MKTFKNKEEICAEWKVNNACHKGVTFNNSCKNLQEILNTCPHDFRIWRIIHGYSQFLKHLDWQLCNDSDLRYIITYGTEPYKDKTWKLLLSREYDNSDLRHIISYCTEPYKGKAKKILKT